MRKTLLEGSPSYHAGANVYDAFSKAEDAPGKVKAFLKTVTKNKTVLDLGCGTGRFARVLASSSKKYIGIDSSPQQLRIARRAIKSKRVLLLQGYAQDVPLPSESVDVVLATWVISTMKGARRKAAALKEASRVLKRGGMLYLVENSPVGEFERIRGHPQRVKRYRQWLLAKGFRTVKRISTYFRFDSFHSARQIIDGIWGKNVSSQVTSRMIKHNVIIYAKTK